MTDDLRTIRQRLGYTLAQAAQAVGCSSSQIVRIESGEHEAGTIGLALARHEKLVGVGLEERVPAPRRGRPPKVA